MKSRPHTGLSFIKSKSNRTRGIKCKFHYFLHLWGRRAIVWHNDARFISHLVWFCHSRWGSLVLMIFFLKIHENEWLISCHHPLLSPRLPWTDVLHFEIFAGQWMQSLRFKLKLNYRLWMRFQTFLWCLTFLATYFVSRPRRQQLN